MQPFASGYRADVVLPDTAAARAGLREGDRLVELDGRSSRDLTPNQLRDLLSLRGETRSMVLMRGDQVLRLALTLEERL